jgi:hypothetical protein
MCRKPPEDRNMSIGQRKKYLIYAIALGLAFLALNVVMQWLHDVVLAGAKFRGANILRYVTFAGKLIGEGGVVASIIGLLLEFAHFRRFYDAVIRKALVDEDYLKKFDKDTLDGIIRKSYTIRNENEITNKMHSWQEQFNFAWEHLREVPTRPYYRNFIHKLNYLYYSKNELQKIESKLSNKFKLDLSRLDADILLIEEIRDYDLISPYLAPNYQHRIATGDYLRKLQGISNDDVGKLLVYELEKNGIPIHLNQEIDYSHEDAGEYVRYRLHHVTEIEPASHICQRTYSVEPQIDDFYCYFLERVADRIEVYLHFNIELSKLDYEYWFPYFDADKFKQIQRDKRNIIFSYETWVFPGNGFMATWQR